MKRERSYEPKRVGACEWDTRAHARHRPPCTLPQSLTYSKGQFTPDKSGRFGRRKLFSAGWNSARFIKGCSSATEFLNQADFQPVLHQKEQENSRQILSCRLMRLNLLVKNVRVNSFNATYYWRHVAKVLTILIQPPQTIALPIFPCSIRDINFHVS